MAESISDPRVGEDEPSENPAAESERIEFKCENCAAKCFWDPATDTLLCKYCGFEKKVPRGEGTIEEYRLDEAGSAARGLGLEVRVADCGNCGARVTFDTEATAKNCVFCGSSNVLDQDANRNAIRPESLIPMDVGAGSVEESFREWIHGLWFRPNAIRRAKTTGAVGIYVPYWTFDCRVHSEWSADSGTYYYVTIPTTVIVNGKPQVRMQRKRKVRWRPAWGDRDDTFDDLLVNASKAIPDSLAKKLGGYDTAELVPYRPEYLAGWHAEEYRVDLVESWDRARERVVAIQRSRCAGDVPGDTHRHLRVQNHISDTRWKHVLLPIWALTYSFSGKAYTVLINGQSGRVQGEAPLSWVKILVLVLAILGGIGLFLLISGIAGR